MTSLTTQEKKAILKLYRKFGSNRISRSSVDELFKSEKSKIPIKGLMRKELIFPRPFAIPDEEEWIALNGDGVNAAEKIIDDKSIVGMLIKHEKIILSIFAAIILGVIGGFFKAFGVEIFNYASEYIGFL